MSTDPDMILLETEEAMTKAVDYLKHEMRGLRTGRASTALVDFIKVDYYGTMTELKALASISIPEPAQIVIKPFDISSLSAIKHAIDVAQLGINPIQEAKQIRLNVPPLSSERRQQMVTRIKKVGEEQKVAIRNTRRDANKHAEGLTTVPEDEVETLKEEIQKLLKKYEAEIDKLVEGKSKEITEL